MLKKLILVAICILPLGLSACTDDDHGDHGIAPRVMAMAQSTYMTADTPDGEPDEATNPSAEASTIKPFYRSDNMYIQLQLGLVNLQLAELVPCSSLSASAASALMNFLFPAAHAHAKHIPNGPEGVMDVLKPDLLVWDLGAHMVVTGEYCGVKIKIAPYAMDDASAGDPHGHGDHMAAHSTTDDMHMDAESHAYDMDGKAVVVSPCYYPDTAGTPRTPADSETSHSCIEAAYAGEAMSHTVMFSSPVTLTQNNMNPRLTLATLYDQWFEGLDMTTLADDAHQQHMLAMNVLKSFYVYAVE